ncbi:MAG: hypothetical protein H7Z41_15800 [Cytophagales bacterium]|nr:hypothetical protein [Armatimonadota bacterium]
MNVEKAKEFLLSYYGPENPNQKWIITLTVLAILMVPRGTRRPAAILAGVVLAAWLVSGFVFGAFRQFAPD